MYLTRRAPLGTLRIHLPHVPLAALTPPGSRRGRAASMADDAAKQALLALHAQLFPLLPDIIKLEELLRASLAALTQASDVATLLYQRQHQCVAAVALLRGLPAGAEGRWVEGLQALLAAKPFIESSAAMIRDVQVRWRWQAAGTALGYAAGRVPGAGHHLPMHGSSVQLPSNTACSSSCVHACACWRVCAEPAARADRAQP